jgi:hypothetical protein
VAVSRKPASTARGSSERRASPRLILAQRVRVRPADPRLREEVLATENISRGGLYFLTPSNQYSSGMHLDLAFPFRIGNPLVGTILATVVRLEPRESNSWGVAVKFI